MIAIGGLTLSKKYIFELGIFSNNKNINFAIF